VDVEATLEDQSEAEYELMERQRRGEVKTFVPSGLPNFDESHGGYAVGEMTVLGARPREVWRSPDRYGIYLFDSEAEVRALAPDLKGLGALGDDQFICTAPGTRSDVVSRVFVPGGGVDEDSVTGSAHAALTPFWAARLGRDSFTAHQASGRGGDLTCRLEGAQAWLGGECVTVVEGTFYLDG